MNGHAVIVDRVTQAAEHRRDADMEYRHALTVARAAGLTWQQIADAAGVTPAAIRYMIQPPPCRRKPKGA